MGLLSGIEGVELVPYDKKSGWKGVWNLWMFLKNNQFDALLNMQTAFRASIISLGIQAKYKIGFGKKTFSRRTVVVCESSSSRSEKRLMC